MRFFTDKDKSPDLLNMFWLKLKKGAIYFLPHRFLHLVFTFHQNSSLHVNHPVFFTLLKQPQERQIVNCLSLPVACLFVQCVHDLFLVHGKVDPDQNWLFWSYVRVIIMTHLQSKFQSPLSSLTIHNLGLNFPNLSIVDICEYLTHLLLTSP